MRKTQLVVAALLLALLLVACTPKTAQAPTPQAAAPAPAPRALAAPQTAAAPAKAAWEVEWEKTVEAAKREGELVIFSGVSQWRIEFTKALLQKYGMRLQVIVGDASDLLPRIVAERRAGIFSYDVYVGGDTTAVTRLKPAGVFEPMEPALILPEVTDPKIWYGGTLPWLEPNHAILASMLFEQAMITINTKLVSPPDGESYRDFLQPKYKGKILISEHIRGGGLKTLRMIGEKIMGWDYLRELAKQQPVIVGDSRLAADWLAFGKGAVLFGPSVDITLEMIGVGVPVKIVAPKEGSYLTVSNGAVALINRAPHPYAAKVFVNWLLSKEGMTLASKTSGYQSAREDVPTDFLNQLTVRKPGAKYVFATGDAWYQGTTEAINKMKEIFGP